MPKHQPKRSAKPPRVPSYCLHQASGQAYCKVRGQVLYLGVHGSKASRTAYAAVVADVLSGREVTRPTRDETSAASVTVRDVCQRFIAIAHYFRTSGGSR